MTRRLVLLTFCVVVACSMFTLMLNEPAITKSALETPTSAVYLPLVPLSTTPGPTPGNIKIDIKQPTLNSLAGDSLQIAAAINSLYELETVKAAVGARETNLAFSNTAYCDQYGCHPGWAGTIPLAELSRGGKTLTVTAKDVVGETATATRSFIHDRPPVLNVTAPITDTVARPQVRLTVSCTDDDPAGCASIEVKALPCDGSSFVTGHPNIDTSISLSAYDGHPLALCFVATDSVGQQTTETRAILVESSTKLSEIETVGGRIWDVQTDRILFLDNLGILKIRDRVSSQDTSIPSITGKVPGYGFLAPSGAIFVAQGEATTWPELYDWRNGTLVDLGTLNSGGSLRVAGRYAIWNGGGIPGQFLYRRDLLSGTITTVSTNAGNWRNGVAANGDVVFWSTQYQVFRYREGTTTQLTNDAIIWNTYPSTDGINVGYKKSDPCCGNQAHAIAMYGSLGEVTLAPARPIEPSPGSDYQLNNGWVAFTDLGTGGQLQVWTRSPSGEERQASHFGTFSRINGLGATGQVTFVNGNRLYLATTDPTVIDIGTDLGRSFWLDGEWLVTIGRSLFRVVP